jgi:hypothetical protein
MTGVRTGIQEERSIGPRAAFHRGAVDDHGSREVEAGNLDPVASDKLLRRLIEVGRIEPAGKAAKLPALHRTASGGIGRAKDLWFRQEVPFSVRHRCLSVKNS